MLGNCHIVILQLENLLGQNLRQIHHILKAPLITDTKDSLNFKARGCYERITSFKYIYMYIYIHIYIHIYIRHKTIQNFKKKNKDNYNIFILFRSDECKYPEVNFEN